MTFILMFLGVVVGKHFNKYLQVITIY